MADNVIANGVTIDSGARFSFRPSGNNGSNLQASYTGGDGNDLTLTVVP